MTSWSSSIKSWFLQAYSKKMSWCETEMQKYVPLVKQNVMKFEVFILGGQRIVRREIRDGGEGVERGLRWKQREDRDREKRD